MLTCCCHRSTGLLSLLLTWPVMLQLKQKFDIQSLSMLFGVREEHAFKNHILGMIHRFVFKSIIVTSTPHYAFLFVQVIQHPELKLPWTYLRTPMWNHTYSNSMVHLLTNEVNRYIVGDRFHDGHKTSGHKKTTCKYHNIDLCPELVSVQSVTSEVLNSKIESSRLQSSNQQNLHHYFFIIALWTTGTCRWFISSCLLTLAPQCSTFPQYNYTHCQ